MYDHIEIADSAIQRFMNLFSFEEISLNMEIILDSLRFSKFRRLTDMIACFSYIFDLNCFRSKALLCC